MSDAPDGYGYDPTTVEPIPVSTAPIDENVPSKYTVPMKYLPPVGQQGTAESPGYPGSCAAWATTYGLATYTAAKKGLVDPSSSSGQASPAYIYIQVLKQLNLKKNSKCVGSTFKPYFDMLNKTGTPTMETAAYEPNCGWLWGEYDNPQKSYPCDKNFKIGNPQKIDVKTDLTALKYWLSQDHALAYGTSLGDNWSSYRGETVPYITHTKKKGKDGKLAGHCMLIIGYDDNIGDGAVLIQNSEGTAWGSDGYVWMAYKTFQWLAQGDAFYVE